MLGWFSFGFLHSKCFVVCFIVDVIIVCFVVVQFHRISKRAVGLGVAGPTVVQFELQLNLASLSCMVLVPFVQALQKICRLQLEAGASRCLPDGFRCLYNVSYMMDADSQETYTGYTTIVCHTLVRLLLVCFNKISFQMYIPKQ